MFRKHFEAIIIKIARLVLGEQFSGFSIKVIHLVSVSGFWLIQIALGTFRWFVVLCTWFVQFILGV